MMLIKTSYLYSLGVDPDPSTSAGTPQEAQPSSSGSGGYTQLRSAAKQPAAPWRAAAGASASHRNTPWLADAGMADPGAGIGGGGDAPPSKRQRVEGAGDPEVVVVGEGGGPGSSRGVLPEGEGPVDGVDPEVWAALPPDIQRELRLTAMASMGRGGGGGSSGGQGGSQRASPKRGGAIAQFFAKK